MNEASTGVVVIGRNEGERLRSCLASLADVPARVYVDSGSTDGSSSMARSFGFEVVDLAVPPSFTAARARNAGIKRLLSEHPKLAYVQTVDGDCVVENNWLATAQADLESDPKRAVVFGRRREVQPQRNCFHVACNEEWKAPLGEVPSCGGDAFFRLAAFEEVEGFNPSLIAGEEPDLCLRLRQNGWRIWSNGRDMTSHDVDIDRLSQWWRRSRRTGFAITELIDIHRGRADPAWRRLVRSALIWSVVALVTIAATLVGLAWNDFFAFRIAAFFGATLILQLVRLAARERRQVDGFGAGLKWACLMMVAKAAQAAGWAQYWISRSVGGRATLIEYKQKPLS